MSEFLAINKDTQLEVEHNGDYVVLHFIGGTLTLSVQINDLGDLTAMENMLMSAITRWEEREEGGR